MGYWDNKAADSIYTCVRAGRWILRKAGSDRCLRNRCLPGGSPFATAMAVKGLALATGKGDLPEKVKEMLSWLLENQKHDGSWESSFFMLRIPPYHPGSFRDESADEFPDRWTERVYPDIRSVMTTAFVLDTLLILMNSYGNSVRIN